MTTSQFLIHSLSPTRHLKRRLLFLRSFSNSAVMTESPKLNLPASGLCMMYPPDQLAGLFSGQTWEKGPDRLNSSFEKCFSKIGSALSPVHTRNSLMVA